MMVDILGGQGDQRGHRLLPPHPPPQPPPPPPPTPPPLPLPFPSPPPLPLQPITPPTLPPTPTASWKLSSKRDSSWFSYIEVHWNVPISRPLQSWLEWNIFFRLKSVGGMVAQTNRSRLNRKQHRSVDAIIPTEHACFHPKEMFETTNCLDSLLCTDMYQSSDFCKGDGNGRIFFRIRSVGGMVARTNRSILTQWQHRCYVIARHG